MSALGETLAVLARVLDAQGLGWYVFGAQAVAIRGAPRATQDLDVTVAVSSKELPDLVSRLNSAGLWHRYPERATELIANAAVVPLRHDSGMEVDLVISGSGLEQLALERANRVVVEGTAVPVAHATDLAVMKVLAGRGKDLDDLRALLAGDEVDVTEVRSLLTQLEQALGQSDLLPALEAALAEVSEPNEDPITANDEGA